jgi:manganese transport protein
MSATSVRPVSVSFAVVPLVYFTGQRRKMGEFVNSRSLAALAWWLRSRLAG